MSSYVLQVTAGVGPVEVRRFVAQLAEYLVGLCEERGGVIREIVVRGDETAPSSVEIHVASAPSSLASMAGTHALVARSSERGKRARKRWYAGVQICEATHAQARAAPIERGDVTITAMRAGGPGGQNVNKTASAVRVFHRASGITVRVSDERSQHDNVRVALARLAQIMVQREKEDLRNARAERRSLHYRVERGRPAFVYATDRDGRLVVCEEAPSNPSTAHRRIATGRREP